MSSVPDKLFEVQKWFGSCITQRIYSDIAYEKEPSNYIVSTETLSAGERMQLYNQSYWLRLLAALHEEYPFLSRLFGKDAFDDEIGIDYLTCYPPTHWSLNLLGKDLFSWLQDNYTQNDKKLILDAAEIDWACQRCFFAPKASPLDLSKYQGEKADLLLDEPLKIAAAGYLIETDGDLLPFRQKLLQEEHAYWVEHDFPKCSKDGTYYYLIFRNRDLNVSWEPLEKNEYLLLRHIQAGATIGDALEKVEVGEEAAFWVQKWLIREWLEYK